MANLKIENLDPVTLEQLSADELSQVVGGCGGNNNSITVQSANSDIDINSEPIVIGDDGEGGVTILLG